MNNCEELMNECIKLFPKFTWKIEYSFKKDMGNELVPYCYVAFGDYVSHDEEFYDYENYNYDYNTYTDFDTLFLKNDGTYFLSNGLLDSLDYDIECCRFGYETDIYDLIKEIHDELIKWANKTDVV